MTTAAEKYKVKTAVFEGPFELLLRLVEERKLFINEISLAQVTDDYLNYVKSLQAHGAIDMMELTGFIVVAATLVLIKSKSLLPNLQLTNDEQGQIDDLEQRLRFYKAIKDIAPKIKEQFGRNIIFAKPESSYEGAVFAPDPQVTVPRMLEAINEVIQAIPKKEFLPEVSVKKVVSIEEMIGSLTERIQASLRFSFSDLSKGKTFETKKEEKVYVIVSFLAMLELVRSGIADVIQGGNFEDIEVLEYKEEIISTNI
jgi:segregation and condensation protein A